MSVRGRSGRRTALLTSTAALAAVAAGGGVVVWRSDDASALTRVAATSPAVQAAEDARRAPGAQVREVALTAAPTSLSLGGETVQTWAFNGSVPGPEIRVTEGDVLRATVRNDLPQPLTIHWHGIALRNDMDGVPDVTQRPIAPGASQVYEFAVPDAGSYFYHSHVGVQLDRGTYGALVVEDSGPAAERDIPVLLDDWLDGTGTDPDTTLADLQAGGMAGMDMGGMDMGGSEMAGMDMGAVTPDTPLGEDTGDVAYPYYLVNGRPAGDPATYDVRPGERVRLRLINAAADTPFRVAVGGQRLTVVATDGFPVEPVEVDTLLLGMGERYDVLVTAPATGAVPLVALAEGKDAVARAVLRAGEGPAPAQDLRPAELDGQLLALSDLRATTDLALPARKPDRTYTVGLTGDMQAYEWGISAPEEAGVSLPVREGERIRLVLQNRTMMFHPMHLHGHTFSVVDGDGAGTRKDTVVVPPMGTVTVELDADNPGQWLLHCHNGYHAEAGMTTTLSYVR